MIPARLKPILLQVADIIENDPSTYNQRKWCGSACCIGGKAAYLLANKEQREMLDRHNEGTVEELLGVAHEDRLFNGGPDRAWPEPWRTRWADIDRSHLDIEVVRKEEAAVAASYIRYRCRR